MDTELGRHFVDFVTQHFGDATGMFFAEHVMPKRDGDAIVEGGKGGGTYGDGFEEQYWAYGWWC